MLLKGWIDYDEPAEKESWLNDFVVVTGRGLGSTAFLGGEHSCSLGHYWGVHSFSFFSFSLFCFYTSHIFNLVVLIPQFF